VAARGDREAGDEAPGAVLLSDRGRRKAEADGALGEYLHLQKNGVLVKVGDEVQAGDLVARSGNTGCSTGPHLHFHVRQPLDGSTWRSVPVRFWTTEAAKGNRGGRRTGKPEEAVGNRRGWAIRARRRC
jgi:murein DD-endopeptidase MepM/ murein hydrolase activator NlpD